MKSTERQERFDICIGNPPYGIRKKGSTADLHYKIFQNSLTYCKDKLCFIMPSSPIVRQLDERWYSVFKNAVCKDIEVVDKKLFPGTIMDDTAIYYCERGEEVENYCRMLDVDKRIYDKISDEGRMIIDKLGRFESIKIFKCFDFSYKYDVERTKNQIGGWCQELNDGKYYLNVNRFYGPMGGRWLSSDLEKVDVKTKDEEMEFYKSHIKRKNIIECPSRKYGENLKKLMVEGKILRYGLWLLQTNQAIYQAQFKYVPGIDYEKIDTDEKLLQECGFEEDEIKKIIGYLETFDFKKNRNEFIKERE